MLTLVATSVLPGNDASATMLASIRSRASLQPNMPALCAGKVSLDYTTLLGSAERLAAVLRQAGMQRDDLVALVAERDVGTLTLMLAILLGGGCCLPLDAGYPAPRLAMMLEDAKPRLLIAEAAAHERFPKIIGMACHSRHELESAAEVMTALSPVPAMAELIYVLFTSGSSGRPKGVAMRSDVLARLVAWHVAHPRLGCAARTLQFAPLSFDVSFQEMLTTFATGGALVLPTEAERRDPYALLALLLRERVERLFLPYVALQTLAEAVAAGGELPTTLRDVITAGEQLRITPAIRALFGALPGCVLHNHYGPTETHVVTAHELAGDVSLWPELPPIGRPLPYVQVRVLDAAQHAVAAGHEGELLLGGDCLAAGYIHRPELTAERFIELDGKRWYRTGDGVRDSGDGVLDYLGRLDDQIKLDGYRVEPAEIEAVLSRHPLVAEAAVVAAGDAQQRRLVANVVTRDATLNDAELAAQLRSFCEGQLAAYLVPHAFVVLAALPLTASGKIDRRTLAGSDIQVPLEWPEAAPLQRQLTALWQQLIGVSSLEPHDNLFDLGARSLMVVRALTELRRHGFHHLSAAQIYDHPSVAKLAALLSGTTSEATTMDDSQARGDRQRAALARFGPRPGAAR
ncbi:MAG: non-ribosomal peptide synthetase [Rhodanobacter sp.]